MTAPITVQLAMAPACSKCKQTKAAMTEVRGLLQGASALPQPGTLSMDEINEDAGLP